MEGCTAEAMLAMDPFLGLGLPNEQALDPYWLFALPTPLPAAAAAVAGPGAPSSIQLSVSVQQAIKDAVVNVVRVSVVDAVTEALRVVTRNAVGQAVGMEVTQQAQAPPAPRPA